MKILSSPKTISHPVGPLGKRFSLIVASRGCLYFSHQRSGRGSGSIFPVNLTHPQSSCMRPSIRATTERRTAAPRMGGMGQRVYKPLLGVADTNHLLSIHIWVMLDNAEQLIQVRKWLRGLLDPVPHGHVRHRRPRRPGWSEGQI